MKKISKLYRFEKAEDKRIETIRNGSLWLSAPKNFNDLYDCNLKEIMAGYYYGNEHHDNLKRCIEILYKEESEQENFILGKEALESLKIILEASEPVETGDKAQKHLRKQSAAEQLFSHIQNTIGICCFFNGEPRHPLMWAHYANNHTGFCIEYSINNGQSENEKLHPVIYQSELPIFTLRELLFCPEETVERLTKTKSLEWNYEKEVRIIRLNTVNPEKQGHMMELPKNLKPSRIITGSKISPDNASKLSSLSQSLGRIPITPYEKFLSS